MLNYLTHIKPIILLLTRDKNYLEAKTLEGLWQEYLGQESEIRALHDDLAEINKLYQDLRIRINTLER